jgi:hypothetical protein
MEVPVLPFHELPLFLKILLLIFSVLVLTIGSSVIWRMLRSALGRGKPTR